MTPELDLELEALLEYVRQSRGLDFTGYKRSSLMRRLTKRLQSVNLATYSDYQEYLQQHPDEFRQLFNTLLINVTAFFRDRPAWEYLISQVLPLLLTSKAPDEPIRIWSAGCATGEEAYTLAMAIAEVLGIEQVSERVKIYATDMDEEALSYARQGIYAEREVAAIHPDMRAKYFERSSQDRYTFRKELRRVVVFGRHDLIQDPPISKLDLLVCRNTLMYFNAETQAKILTHFYFALRDGGTLFLGKAEMLLTHAHRFRPIALKHRIFTKVPKDNGLGRSLDAAYLAQSSSAHLIKNVRLKDAVLDNSPVAQLVVDGNGLLQLANAAARELFGITPYEIERPLRDLELFYCPVDLRSGIERVYQEQRPLLMRSVGWRPALEEPRCFDIEIAPICDPLCDPLSDLLGISIRLTDITQQQRLQEELEQANYELEAAYEELQAANEELETTSEELLAANEELQSTNEELQSTNEELETMNEELQSTNEQLQSVNSELQQRTQELNQSNAFLESILASFQGGVVVLSPALFIQVWNHKAEDLWGVRSNKVLETSFFALEIGLPVEDLLQPIQRCLSSRPVRPIEVTIPAIDRHGRAFQCHVTCTPLRTSTHALTGVILVMEEQNA